MALWKCSLTRYRLAEARVKGYRRKGAPPGSSRLGSRETWTAIRRAPFAATEVPAKAAQLGRHSKSGRAEAVGKSALCPRTLPSNRDRGLNPAPPTRYGGRKGPWLMDRVCVKDGASGLRTSRLGEGLKPVHSDPLPTPPLSVFLKGYHPTRFSIGLETEGPAFPRCRLADSSTNGLEGGAWTLSDCISWSFPRHVAQAQCSRVPSLPVTGFGSPLFWSVTFVFRLPFVACWCRKRRIAALQGRWEARRSRWANWGGPGGRLGLCLVSTAPNQAGRRKRPEPCGSGRVGRRDPRGTVELLEESEPLSGRECPFIK